jgi:hypothetical protein
MEDRVTNLEPVLHAAQVVGAGLIAGALLIVTAAVIPSMRAMTLGAYVSLHQEMERHVERYLPPVGRCTVAVSLATVVLGSGGSARVLASAGLAMLAMVVLTSEARMAACNKAIASWQPTSLPAEADDIVGRWAKLNAIRTVAAVGAFVSFAAAVAIGS